MKKVFGVGVNDSPYETQKFEKIGNGKWRRVWVCPYYKTWKHLLERCYSETLKKKYPTYEGVTCTEEWLTFSNFKRWMECQDWKGKHLDKDILKAGNKVYCPEFCVFVPKALNNFLTNTQRTKLSELPLGVCWNKDHGKYQVRVSNPFSNTRERLGYFSSVEAAVFVYNSRKQEIAALWAEEVTDTRLKSALLSLFKLGVTT